MKYSGECGFLLWLHHRIVDVVRNNSLFMKDWIYIYIERERERDTVDIACEGRVSAY